MEINDIFSSDPKSLWEYLRDSGIGLYIPEYKSPYRWNCEKQIRRLFEDASHGFSQLIYREDSITFLGTLITIHDTQLVTVSPIVKGDVPAKVMTVIDGQQRLTTFLLMSTVFHEEIKLRLRKLEIAADIDGGWLAKECKKIISRLSKTFEEDMSYGDGAFQFYPKMIRAYVDSWSRDQGKASYASPIGRYLHEYGIHARNEHKKAFKYNVQDGTQDYANHKFLSDSKEYIKKLARLIAEDTGEFEVPTLQELVKAEIFQNTLTKAEFPQEVRERLLEDGNESYKELIRLVLFGNFYLDRIAITIVTAKNEDYAFDMFEALNTTGEPLTAFETFKPRVIASEGLGAFEKSPSREFIKPVENYLEGFIRTSDKQDATSQLMVSFALAERGEKLSKSLSDQRRFLKEKYDELVGLDEKRAFIQHLSHAAIFIQNAWPEDKQADPKLPSAETAQLNPEVLLCLDFLRQSNHSITLGPLIRFYSEICRANSFERSEAIQSFIEAVKAITAFSVLWRSSRRGTENIDSVYRELMKEGEASFSKMEPLSRRPDGIFTGKPSAEKLKIALTHMLKNKGGITGKDDWIKATISLPAYSNQIQVTRFLLIAAAHNSIDDKMNPGLTVSAKEGVLPMLTYDVWKSDVAKTIEHIAPKQQIEGWPAEIYENPENLDKLGNLTLLPGKENASLSNRTWLHKKLIYSILSAPTADDLEVLRSMARTEGIELSQSTAELLEAAKYLPLVKALTNVDSEWDLQMIESRSYRIAEISWERIAPWLGIFDK